MPPIIYKVFIIHTYKFLFIGESIISFFAPFLNPFFFVYRGAKFVLRKALTFGADRVTIQMTKDTSDAARAAFGVFCLTTVYPTSTHGAHGNSGDKSAGKDVFPSGKGRKWLETSGNRYSQILWDSVEKRRIMTSSSLGESPYFMRSSSICIPFEPFSCSVFDHSYSSLFPF